MPPQVWLYRNPNAREVVVAFRGTEQVKWKDFVTDLNLTPAAFNPERVDSNAGLPWMARALKLRKAEVLTQLLRLHSVLMHADNTYGSCIFRDSGALLASCESWIHVPVVLAVMAQISCQVMPQHFAPLVG